MTTKIPARIQWAVETLAVAPDDHLLEIGCGTGVAVALIAEHLSGGKIVAIDRSEKMIAQARKKNQALIEAGQVDFQVADVETMDFGEMRFNKIFAVNVNLFWTKPAAELQGVIKRLKSCLQAGGNLYLFYEPPDISQTQIIADMVMGVLVAHDFIVREVLFKDLGTARGVGIIAHV